jgi:DNA-directed RNA polymerase subunit RPC12/RpoP
VEINQDQPNFETVILQCIDCGRDWVLTRDEQLWLFSKNLAMKKRCPYCIAKRRIEKEKTAAGNDGKGGNNHE